MSMDERSTQKVALVIGGVAIDGQSSIGAAISQFLADADHFVLPLSSQAEKVRATLAAINQCSSLTERLTVDVTDRQALKAVIAWVHQEFKGVDILVNAQGIGIKKPTVAMQPEDWSFMLVSR